MNLRLKKPLQPQKMQLTPRWKVWTDKRVPPFKVQKRHSWRELCVCELPEELKYYSLEHSKVPKIFIHQSIGEHDSASMCCSKNQIKVHIEINVSHWLFQVKFFTWWSLKFTLKENKFFHYDSKRWRKSWYK